MSKYTTEVRFICESKSGFTEAELQTKSVDEIITASRNKIFNFEYPIYESNHKPVLETKILKHYYTREIAGETVALWQLWLNERLNLIMPKYNKLYKAEQSILDKELKNIDVKSETLRTDDLLKEDDYTRTDNLHEVHDNTRTDNLHEETDVTETRNLTDTNTHHDSDNKKYSDTPQGSITFAEANEEYYWLTDYTETANNGGATDLHTGTVRTAGEKDNTGTQRNAGSVDNTGTQKNVGSTSNTGTQEIENEEFGYRGGKTYAELMSEYSERVLNIDKMIVYELNDLFIKLW